MTQPNESDVARCRACGCTNARPCVREAGMLDEIAQVDDGMALVACGWAEADLCTACTPGAGDDWRHP